MKRVGDVCLALTVGMLSFGVAASAGAETLGTALKSAATNICANAGEPGNPAAAMMDPPPWCEDVCDPGFQGCGGQRCLADNGSNIINCGQYINPGSCQPPCHPNWVPIAEVAIAGFSIDYPTPFPGYCQYYQRRRVTYHDNNNCGQPDFYGCYFQDFAGAFTQDYGLCCVFYQCFGNPNGSCS